MNKPASELIALADDPQVVAAAQQAIMKHPFFEGGAALAFGLARTVLKAVAANQCGIERAGVDALLDRVVKFDECATAEPTLRWMLRDYYDSRLPDETDLMDEYTARFIAALATPPAQPAPAVAIKPLEWEPAVSIGITSYRATAIGIRYYVYLEKDDELWHAYTEGYQHASFAPTRTLDEAKAAAQADYEQRIRSALISTTKPEAPAVSVDAIKDLVRSFHRNSCYPEAGTGELNAVVNAIARQVSHGEEIIDTNGLTWLPTAVSADEIKAALTFYANEWLGSVGEGGKIDYEPTQQLIDDHGDKADRAIAALAGGR